MTKPTYCNPGYCKSTIRQSCNYFAESVEQYLGPYPPTILKNILCVCLHDLVNLNVTQHLIGKPYG